MANKYNASTTTVNRISDSYCIVFSKRWSLLFHHQALVLHVHTVLECIVNFGGFGVKFKSYHHEVWAGGDWACWQWKGNLAVRGGCRCQILQCNEFNIHPLTAVHLLQYCGGVLPECEEVCSCHQPGPSRWAFLLPCWGWWGRGKGRQITNSIMHTCTNL